MAGNRPATLDKSFVGGTPDPAGLIQVGAREYDPSLGRFLSVDPVLEKGTPQRFDGYAYCADNPVSSADPTGTDSQPVDLNTWVYQGSWFSFEDAGGYRLWFELDWYALCNASATQCLGVDDNGNGTLVGLGAPNELVFSAGWYFIGAELLAATPPPPVTCTNTPVAYVGQAPPDTVEASNQQAAQACSPGDFGCELGEFASGLLGVAAIGACTLLTDGVCGLAVAGLLAIQPAYNLLSGRDAGNNDAIMGDALSLGLVGMSGLGGESGRLALGVNKFPEQFAEWARSIGAENLNDPVMKDVWESAFIRKVFNPNYSLHIALDRFAPLNLPGFGEGDYTGMFLNAVDAGGQAGARATQWEMNQVFWSVMNGDRSFDTLNFYYDQQLVKVYNWAGPGSSPVGP